MSLVVPSQAREQAKCWCDKASYTMAVPQYDTIVIGGGVSGLAGALLRARRGERVAIVEKSAHLSPVLRGFVRRGVHMDSGFHYAGSMGRDGLLRHLVHELGIAETFDGVVRTLDTIDRVRFLEPAFDFSFPQGWEALEQRLCDTFPADGPGLKGFLAQVKALWEQARTAFVRDLGRGPGVFFAAGGSLREAVDRSTGNPVVRGLLCSHGILYGGLAHETSLLFHSQIVGSYYESACLIEGGGRTWAEALEQALHGADVELLCDREVSRIDLDEGGGFAAVELRTGERLASRRCISTMHPKFLLDMVPTRAFSPAYRRRIRELQETPSAVVLFGRCPSASFSGNLILANGPDAVMDWTHLPLEERPLFVSSPLSGAGGGVSVICPATLADVPGTGNSSDRRRPEGYQDWKMKLAGRLVQRLSRCAGDLVGRFELLDVATPLTFRDRLSSPEGGLYGIKHRLADMPLLPRTAVKGLYLSGQAVAAPGVLGALCAGFLTESCIV